jgi:hypothetical protein
MREIHPAVTGGLIFRTDVDLSTSAPDDDSGSGRVSDAVAQRNYRIARAINACRFDRMAEPGVALGRRRDARREATKAETCLEPGTRNF